MKERFLSLILLISIVTLCSCHGNSKSIVNKIDHKDSVQIASQAFKTGDGWGYTITLGEKVYIKQDFIPVVQGIKPFTTEDDALKVANLVISKLKNHQRPTLTAEELQSMGIIK